MRNPLNNIQLSLEVMLRDSPPPALEKKVRQLQGEAGRMEGIVQQLLSLARPEASARTRESLENVLLRALVLARGRPITPDLVHLDSPAGPPPASGEPQPRPGMGFKETIAQVERELIVRALKAAGGNRSRAAAVLKIQRRLIYARMQEHGIRDHEWRPVEPQGA